MTQAKTGDTIKLNYTGKLDDGSVFDTTENRDPLQFVLGEDRLIKGFEAAVVGMNPGDTKTVQLEPEQAYGPRRDEMVLDINRSNLPEDMQPQVGQKLQLQPKEGGQPVDSTITRVSETDVTVDANHPLAGRPLTFEIELLEVA